ncbi:hypothetical protein VPH35_044371 [Triticum aestivum]
MAPPRPVRCIAPARICIHSGQIRLPTPTSLPEPSSRSRRRPRRRKRPRWLVVHRTTNNLGFQGPPSPSMATSAVWDLDHPTTRSVQGRQRSSGQGCSKPPPSATRGHHLRAGADPPGALPPYLHHRGTQAQ